MNPSERAVVVQAVLNRTHLDQFAILEYSFNGDTTGRVNSRRIIPPGRPQFPITGALVTLTHEGPGSCTGRVDTLTERIATIPTGFYGGIACPLEPGAKTRLRVVTAKGEIVTAETVIPGIATSTVNSGARSVHLRTDTLLDTLPLNRDRDTLRIDLGAASGRSVQIEARHAESPDDLVLYLFADSLGLAVAGNAINPFDDEGSFIFHPGRYYLLTVALGDSNYFDYVRSLSDPITGRGYLNHLDGGIGVFGSVDVDEYMLRISGDKHDPREGTYRIISRTGGADDLTVDLYLDNDPGFTNTSLTPMSGFVKGNVAEGLVDRSGAGNFGTSAGVAGPNPNSFFYSFNFTRLSVGNPPQPPLPLRYTLNGTRPIAAGDTFTVALTITRQNGSTFRRATLNGRQAVGPVSSTTARH